MSYYSTYLLDNHSSGLRAYYQLDDASGMPQDSGPSGFHASGVGTITYGNSGISGGGSSIGIGNGHYIRLEPAGESTRFRLPNWTLAIWIKGTGTHVTTVISSISFIPVMTKGSSEAESAGLNEAWLLGLDGATNKGWSDFENNVGTNYKLTGEYAVVDSEWTFLVSTYDATTHRIYRNGVQERSAATTATPDASTIYACIGSTMNSAGASAGGYYLGLATHATLWDRALTSGDISGLYVAGSQGGSLNTILRPVSDISTGSWTVSPLYSKIAKTAMGTDPYISSSWNPSNDTCEVKLSGLASPSSYSGLLLRYGYKKNYPNSTQINLTVGLYQTSTLVASTGLVDIPTGWTTGILTVTQSQVSTITGYEDLRVRLTAHKV